ncbi:MAG TPA: hypothetical protein VFD56_15375 [Chitinophagaceae bacterium]|nr:hypothetical protein [Chitinophagaceae bacterium]
MKTIIFFILFMTAQGMSYSQLFLENEDDIFSSQLLNSLKKNDAEALMALFPTVEELYAVMDANAGFYSTRLYDAKATLMTDYEEDILPQAKLAFQHLLTQAKTKGIDWRAIDSMEIIRLGQTLDTGVVHLRFHADEVAFNVEVKLFTDVNGGLKLTQFIKFI